MKYLLSILVLFFALPSMAQNECTDYSGLWRGTCDHSNGSSGIVRWQISQLGCETVLINGVKFDFGRQTASRRDTSGWSLTSYERLSWDRNQDTLDYDIRTVGRSTDGRQSLRGAGFGRLEMINEYIYFESLVDYTSRGPRGGRAWTEQNRCSLLYID